MHLLVSGTILTVACVGIILALTLALDSQQAWLEFPVTGVALLYMVYSAVLLAKHTKLRVYTHVFIWVWIVGSTFRQLSYWVLGPLYFSSVGARGTYAYTMLLTWT